ncbi:MAG: hypothetical protein AAGA48_14400 [Myxococcota bacterium]
MVGSWCLGWYLDKLRQLDDVIERLLGQDKFNAAGLAALVAQAKGARASVDELFARIPTSSPHGKYDPEDGTWHPA